MFIFLFLYSPPIYASQFIPFSLEYQVPFLCFFKHFSLHDLIFLFPAFIFWRWSYWIADFFIHWCREEWHNYIQTGISLIHAITLVRRLQRWFWLTFALICGQKASSNCIFGFDLILLLALSYLFMICGQFLFKSAHVMKQPLFHQACQSAFVECGGGINNYIVEQQVFYFLFLFSLFWSKC